jgi:hypothetical protein
MKAAVVCHIVQRVLSTVWYLMDLTVGQATITAARYLLLAAVAPGVVVFVQHSLNQAGHVYGRCSWCCDVCTTLSQSSRTIIQHSKLASMFMAFLIYLVLGAICRAVQAPM